MILQLQKIIFLLLISLLFNNELSAQNSFLDSLKLELSKKELPDTSRIETLLFLGWNYSMRNADSARLFLNESLKISNRIQNNDKTAQAYNYIGTNFLRISNYDSAFYYYKIAASFYKRSTDPLARPNLYINKMSMAAVLQGQGDQLEAIQYFLDGIDSLEKFDFPNKWGILVSAYTNIGTVYNETGQYEKMLEYNQKALAICNTQNIPTEKKIQVQLLTALAFIKLKQLPPAFSLLQRADSLLKKINSPYIFSTHYGILGRYYKEKKDYDKAFSAFSLSLSYARKINNQFQEENMLKELGILHFEKKEYVQSLNNFLASVSISKKIGDKDRSLISYKYLSEIYTILKEDSKAVPYYQAYIKLKDSLDESADKKKINEIENKYQSQKKQFAINELQKNNQIQELALQHKRTLNIALIAGCVLLFLLALLFFKNYKNKNRLLLQSGKLHRQQLLELENERQLQAAQLLMKGQEDERSRLAKDLHDGVGGLLSGVKLSMSTMKGNVFLSEENAHSFNNVIAQLDLSIAELRRVSHNMMPEALIKYGLKEALENYCENLNHSGKIKVQLQAYGMDQRLDQSSEIIIYRIVQELLNNILKHAEAKNALIQFIRKEDKFTLTVEDDGKGFDAEEAENKNGAGLANIRARAEYLNGSVDIISKNGEGTSVTIVGRVEGN